MEVGAWELAIETVISTSRHRLVFTTKERDELAELQALHRRLEPEIRWLSLRALGGGLLRRETTHARPPCGRSDVGARYRL